MRRLPFRFGDPQPNSREENTWLNAGREPEYMVLCTLDCCLVLLESEMDRICVRWSMLQERLSCVDSPLPYRFANLQEDKQERLAWMGARRSHDYQALCLLDACYVVDGGREFLCKHWDDLHEALAGNCEG